MITEKDPREHHHRHGDEVDQPVADLGLGGMRGHENRDPGKGQVTGKEDRDQGGYAPLDTDTERQPGEKK